MPSHLAPRRKSACAPITPAIHRVPSLAILFGISSATVYRLIKANELTLVKVGKKASGVTHESAVQYAQARGFSI